MATEIFRCIAGSRLFGTATPQSDTDIKAVHIPDARSLLLGTADAVLDNSTGNPTSANTADDVDVVSFPLKKFLTNLSKMETNSLEMLFAPNQHDNGIWEEIRSERFRIMSANKKSFTGYAKAQAMRYAVRGDRIQCLEQLVTTLECLDPRERMSNQPYIVDVLENIKDVRVITKREAAGLTPYIIAFGRECPLSCFPKEAIKVYVKPLKEAGSRTLKATEEGGVDWKGLYHALRIVDEGLELFSTGQINFPCRNWQTYMMVRTGQKKLDDVLDLFEDSLAELEEVVPISDFKAAPDTEWIDEFTFCVHEQVVVGEYEKWRAAA